MLDQQSTERTANRFERLREDQSQAGAEWVCFQRACQESLSEKRSLPKQGSTSSEIAFSNASDLVFSKLVVGQPGKGLSHF